MLDRSCSIEFECSWALAVLLVTSSPKIHRFGLQAVLSRGDCDVMVSIKKLMDVTFSTLYYTSESLCTHSGRIGRLSLLYTASSLAVSKLNTTVREALAIRRGVGTNTVNRSLSSSEQGPFHYISNLSPANKR